MNGQSSNGDRDLLSRLNALKKTPTVLDDSKCARSASDPRPVLAAHLAADEALHANPAHALFSDLAIRFQGLKGAHNRGYTADALKKDGTPLDIPELQNESNNKTVEELLVELGPDDNWALGQDDDIEITALMKDAHGALTDAALKEENTFASAAAHQDTEATQADPTPTTVDLSAFQPSPSFDTSTPSPSPSSQPNPLDLDIEAELTLQRLLSEIALDPTPSTPLSQTGANPEGGNDLAITPGSGNAELDPPPPYCAGSCLDEAVDDALARRFASLSVPQTQTQSRIHTTDEEDDGLNLPSVPTTIRANPNAKSASAPAPPDETETWCIICLADAQVKCLGCDGELYCTKCWMEGHRGADAGFEERGHRAMAFVKGGGLKKEGRGRRLVGA